MSLRHLTIAFAAVATLAGCSSSGVEDDEAGAPAPASPATSPEAEAEPAREERPRVRRVDPRDDGFEIAMGEWALTPEAEVLRPGPVTLVIRNRGTVVHGFEIKAEDGPARNGDDRMETATRELAPGETARLRMRLPEGIYEIECWVGEHDDRGMERTLEVRRGAPLQRVETGGSSGGAVEISGFSFRPETVTVDAGDTVEWVNRDSAPHTATADGGGFDSETLERGDRFEQKLSRPGEYPYICAIHPEMRGVVRVRRPG